MGKKITIQKASELLGVTIKTLKIWDNDNILKATYRTVHFYIENHIKP